MAKRYEVSIEAEHFIHNDLSNCAHWFQEVAIQKNSSGGGEGLALDIMACLVFTAFSVEAKVNFVGWKILQNDWPERRNLRDKIEILNAQLQLNLDWQSRPLETISKLKDFRNVLAHGKPSLIDYTKVVDVEPEVWDALKTEWENAVTIEFASMCRTDEESLWNLMLERAEIPLSQTLTHGGHHLTVLRDD